MATISLQRSRELLKEQGYATDITEQPFNQYTKRRKDLFNLFDLVGIRSDVSGVTGIQACGEDVSDHVKKVINGFTDPAGRSIPPNPYIRIWLQAGNRAFIWAWRKRGERGKRKEWQLREVEFIIDTSGEIVARETEAKVDG